MITSINQPANQVTWTPEPMILSNRKVHLIKQHRAQCMLYAFAMAMNCQNESEVRKIINIIGHDGTEKLWPELPEPLCYRGFNPYEFHLVAFQTGYAIYEFPRRIYIGHEEFNTDSLNIKEVVLDFENDIFPFSWNGVFLTEEHAYAWDGYSLYDPDRLPRDFDEECRNHSHIDWNTYFAVRKI